MDPNETSTTTTINNTPPPLQSAPVVSVPPETLSMPSPTNTAVAQNVEVVPEQIPANSEPVISSPQQHFASNVPVSNPPITTASNIPPATLATPPIVAPAAVATSPNISPVTQTPAVQTQPNTPPAFTPPEIAGWNWGAFCLTWIWGIAHQVNFAFLGLIPIVNFVIMVMLGKNGNTLAWQHRKFENVEQFKAVQKKWAIWGWVILALTIIIAIGLIFLFISFAKESSIDPSITPIELK